MNPRGWVTGIFSPGTEWLTVMGSAVRQVTIHPTREDALAAPNYLWDPVVAPVERVSSTWFRVTGDWEIRAQPTSCALCTHRIHYVREMSQPRHGEILPGWETCLSEEWRCWGRPRHEHATYGHLPREWSQRFELDNCPSAPVGSA